MKKTLLFGTLAVLFILASCKKEDPDLILKDELNGDGTFLYEGRTYTYKKLLGDYGLMIENLAYLPSVSPSSAESETEPRYYVYGYEGTSVLVAKATENYKKYGVLYNLEAAKTACPPGWHLPSDLEWRYILNYNFDAGIPLDMWIFGPNLLTSGLGTPLKSTTGWLENGNGTNEIGFTAIPAGYRTGSPNNLGQKGFMGLGTNASFWSYPTDNYPQAWSWNLVSDPEWATQLLHYEDQGTEAYSVRCLEDWE
jgi:uncharacterized protein (TIGR02145 family)